MVERAQQHDLFGTPPHNQLNQQGEAFIQPALEGLETETASETILENCMVTTRPLYKKHGQGMLWECSVYAPPDIFNQERDMRYQLHTTTYAQEAQGKHLKPGDVVTLRGITWTQELTLQSGETTIINHLTVSHIAVGSRAPRKSVTIYEQQQGK